MVVLHVYVKKVKWEICSIIYLDARFCGEMSCGTESDGGWDYILLFVLSQHPLVHVTDHNVSVCLCTAQVIRFSRLYGYITFYGFRNLIPTLVLVLNNIDGVVSLSVSATCHRCKLNWNFYALLSSLWFWPARSPGSRKHCKWWKYKSGEGLLDSERLLDNFV